MNKMIFHACICGVFLLTGCANNGPRPGQENTRSAQQGTSKICEGMNTKGEVVDSSKIDGGCGKIVRVGEYEGELIGIPANKNIFLKLKIGMTSKQVMDIIGAPTDQGTYGTGKAFIPFAGMFMKDTVRTEFAYKGAGRLVFSHGGLAGDITTLRLMRIVYNSKDTGYR